MQTWHYLDNSATTPLCEEAKSAMLEAMEVFGNPSSLHGAGQKASRLLARARACVANALGISSPMPGELIFTSCGTEASNTALLGTLLSGKHLAGRRVITTDCEHPSVENVMRRLEHEGFEVVRIGAPRGVLDTDAALAALEIPTALVSLMMVNNETGARFDVEHVFRAAKQKNPATFTHCDAVQGFLKVPFTAASLGADLITVSGHKIHAPKGVGALYIKPALVRSHAVSPYLIGGGQEAGLRSGTENMVGICGFGAAATRGAAAFAADTAHMQALRDRLESALTGTEVRVNRPAGAAAPHILNLTLPDIKSQTMLNYLSEQGICVSSGSACSAHGGKTSPSLLSFGLSPHEADCSLRVSFSARNTAEDVDALVAALSAGVSRLVRMRGKR